MALEGVWASTEPYYIDQYPNYTSHQQSFMYDQILCSLMIAAHNVQQESQPASQAFFPPLAPKMTLAIIKF